MQNQTNSGAEEAPDAQELPSLAAGASRQHPQKKRPTTGSAAAASGPAEKAAQSIQPAAEHDAETRQSGKRQATVSEAIARPAASQQPSRRKTVAGGGPAATAVGVSGRSQPPQTSDAKQRAASKSKLAADSASQNELQQTAVEATSKPGASPLKSKGVAPDAAQPDQQESSAAGSDSQSHTSESEEDGSSSEHNSSSEEGGSHELQANGATDAAQAIEVASAGRAATAAGQARAAQQEEMPETLEVVPETQVSTVLGLNPLVASPQSNNQPFSHAKNRVEHCLGTQPFDQLPTEQQSTFQLCRNRNISADLVISAQQEMEQLNRSGGSLSVSSIGAGHSAARRGVKLRRRQHLCFCGGQSWLGRDQIIS